MSNLVGSLIVDAGVRHLMIEVDISLDTKHPPPNFVFYGGGDLQETLDRAVAQDSRYQYLVLDDFIVVHPKPRLRSSPYLLDATLDTLEVSAASYEHFLNRLQATVRQQHPAAQLADVSPGPTSPDERLSITLRNSSVRLCLIEAARQQRATYAIYVNGPRVTMSRISYGD